MPFADETNDKKIDLSGVMKSSSSGPHGQNEWRRSPEAFSPPDTSKIAGWLINHSDGLIKSETQANIVLVVFAVAALGVSFLLMFGGNTMQALPPGSEIIYSSGEPPRLREVPPR